jgi:hypothetical protein
MFQILYAKFKTAKTIGRKIYITKRHRHSYTDNAAERSWIPEEKRWRNQLYLESEMSGSHDATTQKTAVFTPEQIWNSQ